MVDFTRLTSQDRPLPAVRVEGVTGADGFFEANVEPAEILQWRFRGRRPGFEHATREWARLEPGATVDLGDLVLRPRASLRCRLLDERGRALERRAWSPRLLEAASRRPVEAPLWPDGDAWLVESLDAGRYVVDARVRPPATAAPPEPAEVEVGERGVAELDLRVLGEGGVWLRAFSPPYVLPEPVAAASVTALTASGRRLAATTEAADPTLFRFSASGDFPWTLAVDDPRFEPWSVSGVEPGFAPMIAELKGRATLRLEARSARDGEPPTELGAVLRLPASPWRPNAFAPETTALGPGVLQLAHLPAIPGWELEVSCAGHAPLMLAVPELAGGGVVVKQVELQAVVALSGRVRVEDGGPLPRDVAVAVYRPAPIGDGPSVPFVEPGQLVLGELPSPTPLPYVDPDRSRVRVQRADVAGNGAFRIDGLAPGSYVVRAWSGGLEAVVERVEVGPTGLEDLQLVMPVAATLEGRLVGLSAAVLATLEVVARSEDGERVTSIAADGSFVFPRQAPGEWRLALRSPPVSLSAGVRVVELTLPERPFATLEVRGTVRETFDVSALAPGSLAVEVRLDGREREGLLVVGRMRDEAVPADGPFDGRSPWFRGAVGAVTDADGVARIALLWPGRWSLSVSGAERSWCVAVSEVAVLASRTGAVTVEARRVAGRLILRAPNGRAASGRWRVLAVACGAELEVAPDEQGVAEVELPPGEYALHPVDGDAAAGRRFTWPPVSGAELAIELSGG